MNLASGQPHVDDRQVVLEARDVAKSFGATEALRGVSVAFRRGEIHGVIGHNGAGKSTLVKILCGVHSPDAGTVAIDGRSVEFHSPDDASEAGIGLVFQEFSLIPDLTVAQNVFLRTHGAPLFGLIDDQSLERRTTEILARLGAEIPPRTTVRDLGVADRQLVEIAKALSRPRRVLMLDEPTAALSATEVDRLFSVLRALADDGIAIVFISHHLREVLRVCEVVTVLRDGAVSLDDAVGHHDLTSLVAALLGATASRGDSATQRNDDAALGEVVLAVEHLSVPPQVRDVSFQLRSGEVLGIAGLLGSGALEVLEAIFGVRSNASGVVRLGDRDDVPGHPSDAIKRGAFLVPEDRRIQGLVADHPIGENIVMAIIGRLTRFGIIDVDRAESIGQNQAARLQIDGQLTTPVRDLSGGNQQKVVLAKSLTTGAKVLLLGEPTFGIDIRTAAEIVEIVRRFAASGNAAIWVSSDFDELTRVADRVLIMKSGQMVGERAVRGNVPLTEEELLHAVQ